MLEQIVLSELFNIAYCVQDNVIEFIIDELWCHRVVVDNVVNCDTVIYMDIRVGHYEGELRIDRFMKRFQIQLRSSSYTIPPASGDWGEVVRYINTVITSTC